MSQMFFQLIHTLSQFTVTMCVSINTKVNGLGHKITIINIWYKKQPANKTKRTRSAVVLIHTTEKIAEQVANN